MEAGCVERTSRNLIQRFFQTFAVAGEFLRDLAGGRVNSDAVCGGHGIENLCRGTAHAHGVFHCQVHIVKKQGDEPLRKADVAGGSFSPRLRGDR